MSTLTPRSLLPVFIPSVNALLAALSLPFTIEHPTDLTPSLLLAIFESLINARLPIPASVRQSRTQDAKARAMLVLLGVLECDVLRGGNSTDAEHSIAASNADDSVLGGAGGVSVDGWVDEIGLGEVDPERLADGGWEETIFVGELLCWLARRKGILPRTKSSHRSSRSLYSNHHSYGTEGEVEGDTADFSTSLLLRHSPAQKLRSPRPPSPSRSIGDIDIVTDADYSALSHITDVPRHPLVHSPEPSLSLSATTPTDLSIRARSVSSRTSVSNVHDDPDEFEEASHDTIQLHDPHQMMLDADEDDDRPPTFRPRCIHELDDPSYIRALAGPSSFDLSASHEHILEGEGDRSKDGVDRAYEQENDDLYAPETPTPQRVRLDGWIDTVDTAAELSHFAASRSRSRQFRTSADSGSGPSQLRKLARTGELSKPATRLQTHISPVSHPGSGKSRTPRRISPLPSPSPSPPSSPPPPTSSKHPPPHSSPSPPPSPPDDPDPPFDVSFSTLNNTSTPAKPRPPRRPQFQTTTRHEIVHASMDRDKNGGSAPRHRHRERSPSYMPSPPSFTTPGSLRGGVTGGPSATRTSSAGFSVLKTHVGLSITPGYVFPPATVPVRKNNTRSMSPPSMTVKGKSPSVVLAGSAATTNTLLTERARLLTELAALKRARAASNAGKGSAMGMGSGSEVGRRVGVGVRS